MSLRILIPGGSGQLGTLLARRFHASGHQVTVLSRRPQSAPWRTLPWDGRTPGTWSHLIGQTDVVVNLAGRSVDCRYNQANRNLILQSRVDSTRLLGQLIAASPTPPRLWLNASTATIYRHSLNRPQDDLTGELGGAEPGIPSTWKFSIDVATAWESAFFEASTPHTRQVALRTAMVMSPDPGGVFSVLSRLVRLGLGGPVAGGAQYVSWLHHRDWLRALDFLIAREDLSGPINLCSPHPLPYRDFMATLRKAWRQPIGLPATRWMLEIGAFFLRTESELVLKSRRVLPARLLAAGFEFQFPQWPEAALDLVASHSSRHNP